MRAINSSAYYVPSEFFVRGNCAQLQYTMSYKHTHADKHSYKHTHKHGLREGHRTGGEKRVIKANNIQVLKSLIAKRSLSIMYDHLSYVALHKEILF